jgi:hypothetical protein
MSELWINFLQKEADAREAGTLEPMSPIAFHAGGQSNPGTAPGTPTLQGKR